MKLLIVAATKQEISPLLTRIKSFKTRPDVLVTGVGMVATAFQLGKALSGGKYDGAINLGICGSFSPLLKKGEVISITSDILSELGAEDGDTFMPLHDMKLAGKKDIVLIPSRKLVFPGLKSIKKVQGITVNTVHGNTKSISKIIERYKPDVESMEGAAFFYACNQFKIPCLQLRAVSNYVEKRNVKNWDIPMAIKNLNDEAANLMAKF